MFFGFFAPSVIYRAPDSAPLKSKMIYASSKDAIKRKFEGKWQLRHHFRFSERKTEVVTFYFDSTLLLV